MPHFMIVLIVNINLLNLSWIKKKCLYLRNMEPLTDIPLPDVEFCFKGRLVKAGNRSCLNTLHDG